MEHSAVGYALVAFIVFILILLRVTKPREKILGNITFSEVSILPDGVYETLFEIQVRHVIVSHVNAPGLHSRMYAVHIDGMPRNEDGSFVDHFIKEDGRLLP